MEKSLKTCLMPDGTTTQILTAKPFTHACVLFNPFYGGFTVKRWEESYDDANDTWGKFKDKKMKEHGISEFDSAEHESQFDLDHLDGFLIIELNLCKPFS